MSKTTIASGGLADNAVVTGKITDGTIATADIADDAITDAKLGTLTAIVFNGTQSASTNANTLDDYEEGTADVNLRVEGRGDSSVAGTRSSSYTKIGNRVFVRFYMSISSTTGNDSFRQMQIFNLPFNTANLYATTAYASLGGLEANADKHFQIMLTNNSNTGQIQEWDGIQGDNMADHFDTSTVYLEMSYQTA